MTADRYEPGDHPTTKQFPVNSGREIPIPIERYSRWDECVLTRELFPGRGLLMRAKAFNDLNIAKFNGNH